MQTIRFDTRVVMSTFTLSLIWFLAVKKVRTGVLTLKPISQTSGLSIDSLQGNEKIRLQAMEELEPYVNYVHLNKWEVASL